MLNRTMNRAKLATTSLDIDTLPNLPAIDRFPSLTKNFFGSIIAVKELEPGTGPCYVLQNRHFEPLHIWPIDTPIEQIDTEMKENGWTRIPESGEGQYLYIHTKTAEAHFDVLVEGCKTGFIRDRFYSEDMPFLYEKKSVPDVPGSKFGFIRFGDLPEKGLSYSPWSGKFEEGVACFDAEITAEGNYQLVNMTYTLYSVYMALMEEDVSRPVYRLYGDVVGYGWNGEPLVKVEKVERLTGKDLDSLKAAREAAVKDMIYKFLM